MRGGAVVLVPIPQADGVIKNRPAIILCDMPPFGDWLVCGISTQLHQKVAGFDDVIETTHEDFPGSGLKSASLIRLGFLAVLPSTSFQGVIGNISPERHRKLHENLSTYLASPYQKNE